MKLVIFILALIGLVVFPVFGMEVSYAQFDPFEEVCTDEAAESEVCQTKDNTENPISGDTGVLTTVVNMLSFIVGIASVLMIMLGGLKYITSNGDANAVSSAKNTVLFAVVGVVIFLFSRVIITFVISRT